MLNYRKNNHTLTKRKCSNLKNNICYIISHTESKGDKMKIIANNYTSQEIIRIIREWTELSQREFGKTIHRSESGIQAYELGNRNYSMQTLIEIANTHGLTITIEKKGK